MAALRRVPISRATGFYVGLVVVAGFAVVTISAVDLARNHPSTDLALLALLTLLSGFLPVKLPKVAANISVSETFVFIGTLLYGPSAGAVLVFLDVALIWARLVRPGVIWHRMLFSMAANPLAIWVSATVLFWVANTEPLAPLEVRPPDFWLISGLLVFAIVYFLLNSSLVAVAIAIEERLNAFDIWTRHFSRLWLNYWAGASVAALLVSIDHSISILTLLLIAPLMLVIFFTYKWSMERVEKAESHLAEMKRTFLQTIEALALAIDAKDQVTHGHIRRVQRYTMALADALGVTDERQLDALRAAALLHDTGKLAVPEYILNKPGPLTASEFERMKVHAAVGADILKSIDFPYPVEPIVRYHHEAWDGSGYPEGLKGTEIPLGARILAVVDCYDALTSDRPYRPRMTRQQAEQILMERRGRSYDPWVVDQFMRILDQLEGDDAKHRTPTSRPNPQTAATPAQYEAIAATTAEDREFNELKRELPRAESLVHAAEVLFRHLRRTVPADTFAIYTPQTDATDIAVLACSGVGTSAMQGLRVPVGERISGWILANSQSVLNSDATLELGPVARSFSVPLRYATGVPIVDGGQSAGVLLVFTADALERDHRRLLENAATLFVSSVSQPLVSHSAPDDSKADSPRRLARTRVH